MMEKRKSDEIYRIRINLLGSFGIGNIKEGKKYKIVDVAGSLSLYEFAKFIADIFYFDFQGHHFGFFDKKYPEDSTIVFEITDEDITEIEHTRKITFDAKKATVQYLFEKIGQKVYFVFDFGFYWYFSLELLKTKEKEKDVIYPHVVITGSSQFNRSSKEEKEESYGYDESKEGEEDLEEKTSEDEEMIVPELNEKKKMVEFFNVKLGMDKKIIMNAIDEVWSLWKRLFGENVKSVSVKELAIFAYKLLKEKPDNVDVILFVLGLGIIFPSLDEKPLETSFSLFDLLIGKYKFPVFMLLDLLAKHRNQISNIVDETTLSVAALYMIDSLEDLNKDVNMMLNYFKYAFSQGVTLEHSLSFIRVLLSSSLYFKQSQSKTQFVKKLLNYFKKDEETRKKIAFLTLSSILAAIIYGQIEVNHLEDFCDSPIRRMLLRVEPKIYDISLFKILTSCQKVPISAMGKAKYVADELNLLLAGRPWESKFIDLRKIVNLVFRKLYEYLFNDSFPFSDAFLNYLLLLFKSFTNNNYIPLFLIEPSLKSLNIKESKLHSILDLLYKILTNKEIFYEVNIPGIRALIEVVVYHHNKLDSEYVINLLKKFKTHSSGDLRFYSYKYLYELTGNIKYLIEASKDRNKRVKQWATKIMQEKRFLKKR